MIKEIKIREERYDDYHDIAELNYLAFDNDDFAGETILIDVLRHRKEYDRSLSLVAEKDGKIIGHILFNPFDIYSHNRKIKSVNLAPVAVHPDFQKKGIGSALIKKGHLLAEEKGYELSFLFGHPDYYPRFGYIKKSFSIGGMKISKDDIPNNDIQLEEKIPKKKDLQYLVNLWMKNFSESKITLFPGQNILDWVSYSKDIKTSIVTKNEKFIGYLRYERGNENNPAMILADSKKDMMTLLSHLCKKGGCDFKEIIIPLNTDNFIIEKIKKSYKLTKGIKSHDAFMIKPFKNSNFSENILTDKNTGLIILTVHFDTA